VSLRPLDLQILVPRVSETARVERVAQSGQERAAAEVAQQSREEARRGQEQVARTEQPQETRIALRPREGGGGHRQGRGQPRRDSAGAGEAPPEIPGAEPGGRLDIRA